MYLIVIKANLILDKIRLNIHFNFAILQPFHLFFMSSIWLRNLAKLLDKNCLVSDNQTHMQYRACQRDNWIRKFFSYFVDRLSHSGTWKSERRICMWVLGLPSRVKYYCRWDWHHFYMVIQAKVGLGLSIELQKIPNGTCKNLILDKMRLKYSF